MVASAIHSVPQNKPDWARLLTLAGVFLCALLTGALEVSESKFAVFDQTLFVAPLVLYVWTFGQTPRRRIPLLSLQWVLATWLVSLPIYMLWARGWAGLVRLAGLLALLLLSYAMGAAGATALLFFADAE